ncbi:hypothetical protein BOX15_Mlig002395g2 [Macrostomum lignano]|uniref:PBPe domain-containing protein n=2 Tax=Macrostomum lignano TaxID=282301 RepID=A0A267DJA0_9PLAT|nr:hypothetical protein BOX15_Mlig002395g3 [Macrostomum lignano]PAA60517.1 hypothetical protein BOX15_Mlig002395g2 [Macrostomum lignano]
MSPKKQHFNFLLLLLLVMGQQSFGMIGNTYYFLAVYDAQNRDLLAAAQKAIADLNAGTPSAVLPAGKTINVTAVQSGSESLFQTVCKTGNEHLLWIDGILDFTARPSCVEDLARNLDAPIIRASMELTNDVPNVHPSPRNYMRAVAALLLRDNATRDGIMVLYDASFDAGSILPYEDYSWYPPIYLRKIPTTAVEVATLLDEAKTLRIADFVVASSVSNAAMVVQQAGVKSLMGGIYHWFVVTKDLQDFSCSGCGSGSSLFFFRQTAADATRATAVFTAVQSATGVAVAESRKVDVLFAYEAAETMGRVIKAQTDAGSFGNATNWLVCSGAYSPSTPVRYNDYTAKLKALPSFSSVMGNVAFANTLRNTDTTFKIAQIVYPGPTVNNIGTWTKAAGLAGSVSTISLSYMTIRNLIVRLTHDPPFVIKKTDGTFEGYSIDMLKNLATNMNFNYTLVEQTDGIYGTLQSDGTWNGMMGALASGVADMAIGPITVTAQREQIADFTVPIYDYVSLQILLLQPTSSKGDQTFFLKAFTWDVWVSIIAIITFTGFLIFFVDKVSPFSFQNRYRNDQIREGEAEGKVFTVKESLWYVLGAYTQAGESFDPRSMSCRTIIVGFWLFGYLMMSLYTANLAAQLTVDKLSQPPQSFDELTTQVAMKYTVIKDTASYEHFMRMKDAEANLYNYWLTSGIGTEETVDQLASLVTWKYPVIERYTTVWNRMTKWGFATSTEQALDRVRKENIAIFLESSLVKYYTAKTCDFMTVGDPFAPRPYGIALRNKSPLLKQMNVAILSLNENRVTETLKQYWWSRDKVTCQATSSASSGLSLDTLGGAFIFFCIGVGIALIMFVAEKIVAKVYGVEWAKNNADAKQVNTLMMMMGPSTANLRASNSSIRPATGGLPRPMTGHGRGSGTGHGRNSVEPVKSPDVMELEQGAR